MTLPVRLASVFTALGLVFGCSSSDHPAVGPDGSTGTGGSGGSSSTKITCPDSDAETCGAPIGSAIARVTPCCTPTGACGLTMPSVGTQCLPHDLPGAPNNACAQFQPPTGDPLGGCCTPAGTCGALSPFMGCVTNAELSRAPVACKYDSTSSECTNVVGVTCDGAEDCPTGQRCCGEFAGTGYTKFGCFPSCATVVDGGAASQTQVFEICHAGDACEDKTNTCIASTVLPAPLGRCGPTAMGAAAPTSDKAADAVNCGKSLCGEGEQCCVHTPGTPYCAPAGESCECHPANDGGVVGVPKTDGGSDASAEKSDANATLDAAATDADSKG